MLKNQIYTFLFLFSLFNLSIFHAWSDDRAYRVKVERPGSQEKKRFDMGTAVNPSGKSIFINPEGLLVDGKPVLPVMGEFHFSRYPDKEWRKELLKMKAGGITIVANYVFWIHHEEVEGEYDWEGRRNLRKFVETCMEVGLPVVLRIGPWCHGEVRNGGIPDWMVSSGIKLRNSNPEYMEKVKRWNLQIFSQVNGLLWKEGGPIIGVQIENEYRGPGEHLLDIKKMIREIGFDVPLYTRTGWPALTRPITFGEIIPLYGDYADGFWDRSLGDLPGDYWKSFIFRSFRNSTVIATEQLPKQSDRDHPDDLAYPFFTCELGGGMMTSYHRRIVIDPEDVYAMGVVKVGSGSNMPGYYMYHGGTNPEGKLTTLNETQSTPITFNNDLPVMSYDFQAPLGEFGQVNPQYHQLRRLHLFLDDFGSELTAMNPVFPDVAESSFKSDSALRWSVRSNGEKGYLFVSNYQRLTDISPKKNVRFTLDLPDGQLVLPEKPVNIGASVSFFIPFNMDLAGARLIYSTAQPIARLVDGNESVYVFKEIAGIDSEFIFDSEGIDVKSSRVKAIKKDGKIYFHKVPCGTSAVIRLKDRDSHQVSVVLLDEKSSLSFWKGKLNGKEYLFLTDAELTYHKDQIELTGEAGSEWGVSIFPDPQSVTRNGKQLKGRQDGIFSRYSAEFPVQSPSEIDVELVQIRKEDQDLREVKKGRAGVAEQPSDTDFEKAAVWKVVLPENADPSRDIFLRFLYTGDVARIYSGERLLTDNFYNGKPFLLGLKRYAPDIYKKELTIRILPLPAETPLIYLPVKEKLKHSESGYLVDISQVDIEENTTVSLKIESR